MKKIKLFIKKVFMETIDIYGNIKPSYLSILIYKLGFFKVKKKNSNFIVIELKKDGSVRLKPLFSADDEHIRSILFSIVNSLNAKKHATKSKRN